MPPRQKVVRKAAVAGRRRLYSYLKYDIQFYLALVFNIILRMPIKKFQ